jgi:hypothetical protein
MYEILSDTVGPLVNQDDEEQAKETALDQSKD